MPMSTCIDHGYSRCPNKNGYRRAWHKVTQKLELLHRVVYCEHHNVSMTSIVGLSVRHTCDNPRCINPKHLIIGTHADNMKDRSERGRTADVTGELNPKAKLTIEDVRYIRSIYVKFKKNQRQLLADKFKVSLATIDDIISNRSWKNA